MKKIGKQCISLVLTIALTAGFFVDVFFPEKVGAAVYAWDGTTKTEVYPLDDVYWISSPDELAWFASAVNKGNCFVGKTIYITDYINLNQKPWTPIGGRIDGDIMIENCTIEGLNCAKSMAGLFGNVTVKSLTIKNVVIEKVELKGCDQELQVQNKGIIAASINLIGGGSVLVEKVSASGCLDKQTNWEGANLGGLFGTIDFGGDNSSVCIDNVKLNTEINIAGGSEGSSLGGVVAVVNDSNHKGQFRVSRLEIEDKIKGTNTYGYSEMYAGGIIGRVNGGNYYIDQCLIKGSIYSSSYAGWAGGVVAFPSYKTMQITNMAVSASVSAHFRGWYGASHNGGGLLGYSSSSNYDNNFISNCIVTGYIGSGCAFVSHAQSDKDIKVEDSVFNTQTTGLSSTDMYGISKYGYTSNNSVSNSKGYATSELKNADLYQNWDTENIWKVQAGSYPQLRWLEGEDTAYGAKDLENKDIIERVSEYTSDAFYAGYDAIMKQTCSDEKKYQLLANLCLHYGLTDPKEGIDYLSNTSDKRASYVYLTSNELYMAYQLRDFLVNGGVKGAALRSLLVVDGLVFNGELGEWMKPINYVSKDFPWVDKYKNMLYSFMETGMEFNIIKNDYITVFSDLGKIAKNFGKTYKIEVDNLIKDISETRDLVELEELLHSANVQKIYWDCTSVRVNGKRKTEYKLCEDCGFGRFYKRLGRVNDAIKLVDLSFDEFADFVVLDSRIAVYEQYMELLEEIRDEDELDNNLRAAAEQIIKQIDAGALGKVGDVCFELANYLDGTAKISSEMWKELWNKMGVPGVKDFLETIELAAFFSNMVVDMSKVIKYEAYVEGYAQLGSLYTKKLDKAKAEFVQAPSEENAWEFFRLYNLLYRMRVGGEEAYIEMLSLESSIPLIKSYGVNPKLESVKEVVAKIKRHHQFTMDEAKNVPLSSQFAVKTVIKCPVDIKVYDPSGKLITVLEDGVESDITNEYGRFTVVRDYAAEDYKKVICFNDKADYGLEMIAKDYGLVSLEVMVKEDCNLYTLDNIQVEKEDIIAASINKIVSDQMVVIDTTHSGGVKDTLDVKAVKDDVLAESLSLNEEKIDLDVGESCMLEPVIEPKNSSQQQVCWLSSNDKIATVVAGKIVALAKGTVIVNCVSVDNNSLMATCIVTVGENIKQIKVEKIALSLSDKEIESGKTLQLKAIIEPKNADNARIEWNSDNKSVAIVDSNGLVTAVGEGKATITASSIDGSNISASCVISVTKQMGGGGSTIPSNPSGPTAPTVPTDPLKPDDDGELETNLLYYIVRFDANGGKNLSRKEMTLLNNDSIGILPKTTRKNYIFKGWYTQKTGGRKVTKSTVLNAGTTLYAHWSKVSKPTKMKTPVLKASKTGQISVSLKKVKDATGYEIAYSTNKKFPSSSTKKVRMSTLKKTLKDLKSGKVYYVKIRAYKIDSGGNRVYGTYSLVNSIEVQ